MPGVPALVRRCAWAPNSTATIRAVRSRRSRRSHRPRRSPAREWRTLLSIAVSLRSGAAVPASAPSCSPGPAVQSAPVSGCSHSPAPASRFLPARVCPERFATGTALHAQPAGSRPPGPASRHLHALRHEYVLDVAFPITDANDVRVFAVGLEGYQLFMAFEPFHAFLVRNGQFLALCPLARFFGCSNPGLHAQHPEGQA